MTTPKLRLELLLTAEQITSLTEENITVQAFTPAQLQILKRQIDATKRLNAKIKALKYKRRTGGDLLPPTVTVTTFAKQQKRSKATKNRDKEETGDDENASGLINDKSDTEAEDDEEAAIETDSEDSEEEDSDLNLSDSSDDEGSGKKSKLIRPTTSKPREGPKRTSARNRNVMSLKEDNSSKDEELDLTNSDAEKGDDDIPSPGKKPSPEKSPRKRRKTFVVVTEDPDNGKELQLPPMKAVKINWGTGDDDDDDDFACGVCGDGESVDGNVILLCEGKGCGVAVHQLCYGIKKVPKGKWVCDGCEAKLKPKDACCIVCPVAGGPLRKVVDMGKVIPADGPNATQKYIHVACALWTPEIEIKDPENMKDVSIARLTAARLGLQCGLCKQGGGGVIQCAYGACCKSFHVLCARNAQQLLTFKSDGEALGFCSVHSGPRYERGRGRVLEGHELDDDVPEQEKDDEEMAAEPAELVDYEKERQKNLKRIEEAKRAIFAS